LVSKRFNQPSNNRLDETLADRIIKILRSTYADFVPTLATEKLRTKHGHAGERRARCAGWSAVRRYIQPRNILIVKMANPSSDSFASDRDRFVGHDLRPHS
jgi:hypothetical protein